MIRDSLKTLNSNNTVVLSENGVDDSLEEIEITDVSSVNPSHHPQLLSPSNPSNLNHPLQHGIIGSDDGTHVVLDEDNFEDNNDLDHNPLQYINSKSNTILNDKPYMDTENDANEANDVKIPIYSKEEHAESIEDFQKNQKSISKFDEICVPNDGSTAKEKYFNTRFGKSRLGKCCFAGIIKLVDFFNALEKVYCPDQALINLKNYKYASVDKSYLSKYVLRHYWEFCTTLFPRSMAPNLITLVGFFFMIINMIFAIIFVPDLEGPTDRWFYFSCALGLWLYSTFDNVDGKQARRTGTSSPLGELFDHGCDSLNCAVGSIVEAAALGMGQGYYTFILTLITYVTFFYSTWETYYTGRLYLGYVNGPTEGLVLGSLIMLLSGIFGPEMWWKPLSHYLGGWVDSIFTEKAKLIDVIMVCMLLMCIITQIPISIYAVRKACKTNKKYNFTDSLIKTISFLVFVAAMILWVSSPHSVVLSDHLILFIITTGLVFGRIATDIILAHVSNQSYPKFTFLIFPVIIGAILVNIPSIFRCGEILKPTGELIYLWIIFGISVIFYSHWAISVIRRFCNYLDINCLTIKKKKNIEEERV